jgi:hypothetical protein
MPPKFKVPLQTSMSLLYETVGRLVRAVDLL